MNLFARYELPRHYASMLWLPAQTDRQHCKVLACNQLLKLVREHTIL